MCVIVIKPENIKIEYETLHKMWTANPDGAGLAWFGMDSRVYVEKGIMTLKELYSTLDELTSAEVVIHMRLATHGLINKQQTHPFAISKHIFDAKAYSKNKSFKSVLFHNGIISGYGTKDVSDTLDFITRTLAHIPDTEVKIDVLQLAGGKYVLMEDNYLYTVGEFEEFEGVSCSNLHFLNKFKLKSICNDNYDRVLMADYSEDFKWENDCLLSDHNLDGKEKFHSVLNDEYPCDNCLKSSCLNCKYL